MPRNITVTFDDGSQHVYNNAPDDITPDAAIARASKDFGKAVKSIDGGRAGMADTSQPVSQKASLPKDVDGQSKQAVDDVFSSVLNDAIKAEKDALSGALRGVAGIGSTLMWPIDKLTDAIKGDRSQTLSGAITGRQPLSRNEERRKAIEYAIQYGLGADPESGFYRAGKLASELAGTAGAGGVAANTIRAAAPIFASSKLGSGLLSALETSGARGGNLATRTIGGAASGGIQAAAIDPESAKAGALVGMLSPSFMKLAGVSGDFVANLIRPFYKSGQEKIVSDVLNRFASDPKRAIAELQKAQELIPGSRPIAAAAAGDVGLSGLTRAMQNTPDFAAEMAMRQAQQNAARTQSLESVAGNSGKISAAKAERDAATGAMREGALSRAGKMDAMPILQQLDTLLSNPNNAGQTAQIALKRMRDQVASTAKEGKIDARALYEIRKDAGLAMQGKLQGDASNLRYAKGQLGEVQNIFDDAIERASAGGGKAVIPSSQPSGGWKEYLSKYSEASKPINQMEVLRDVMSRIQTGTSDAQGNLILSPAKLNNILKIEGAELQKILTKEQFQLLRNLSTDLNGNSVGLNAGRSVGSNTVQNLAGDNLLQSTLGNLVGGSTAAKTTLGSLLKVPYVRANQDIQDVLGSALLDPAYASKLLSMAQQSGARGNTLKSLIYRSAPALPASSQ